MPPSAFPCASCMMAGGGPAATSRRGAVLGAFPWRTQRLRAAKAALTTKCCGPELIGVPHVMMPGTGEVVTSGATMAGDVPRSAAPLTSRYVSACAVPATSQSRKCLLSSCRAEKREVSFCLHGQHRDVDVGSDESRHQCRDRRLRGLR